MTNTDGAACPIPLVAPENCVSLAHGDGARLSREMIQNRILPQLPPSDLCALGDAAILPPVTGQLAFTTDSFVVSPMFFPGGDIGKLAVIGTLNDLVVAGAKPLWLSLSLIIEEGLPFPILDRILASISRAATEADVQVVTGDTKVVPRGAADQLFINTSGIGCVEAPLPPGPGHLQIGDALIVSGPIGQHGAAVMSARESLEFGGALLSDCAFLMPAAQALRQASIPLRAMRDATRGGIAAVLHEWAIACEHSLCCEEAKVPVSGEVRGFCELLGLDPLMIANEGTMLIAVPTSAVPDALQALHSTQIASQAAVIGHIVERRYSAVTVKRSLGREIALDEPQAALLPRIC